MMCLQAKLNVPFMKYLGQLAAEILSAREQFAMTALGKRKAEAASALPEVRLPATPTHPAQAAHTWEGCVHAACQAFGSTTCLLE